MKDPNNPQSNSHQEKLSTRLCQIKLDHIVKEGFELSHKAPFGPREYVRICNDYKKSATYKLWPRNENRFASSNRLWRRSTLNGSLYFLYFLIL